MASSSKSGSFFVPGAWPNDQSAFLSPAEMAHSKSIRQVIQTTFSSFRNIIPTDIGCSLSHLLHSILPTTSTSLVSTLEDRHASAPQGTQKIDRGTSLGITNILQPRIDRPTLRGGADQRCRRASIFPRAHGKWPCGAADRSIAKALHQSSDSRIAKQSSKNSRCSKLSGSYPFRTGLSKQLKPHSVVRDKNLLFWASPPGVDECFGNPTRPFELDRHGDERGSVEKMDTDAERLHATDFNRRIGLLLAEDPIKPIGGTEDFSGLLDAWKSYLALYPKAEENHDFTQFRKLKAVVDQRDGLEHSSMGFLDILIAEGVALWDTLGFPRSTLAYLELKDTSDTVAHLAQHSTNLGYRKNIAHVASQRGFLKDLRSKGNSLFATINVDDLPDFKPSEQSLSSSLQSILETFRSERTQLNHKIRATVELGFDKFPQPLTEETKNNISKVLQCHDSSTKVSKVLNRLQVSVKDLRTLQSRQWLNDEIINFYLALVCERENHGVVKPPKNIFAFGSFFFSTLETKGPTAVARWASRAGIGGKNMLSLRLLLIPINQGNSHWTFVAVSMAERSITYYDSFGTMRNDILSKTKDYLSMETGATDWVLLKGAGPRQENGYDCGVFVCTSSEFLSRNAQPTFREKDLELIRQRMMAEIIAGKIGVC